MGKMKITQYGYKRTYNGKDFKFYSSHRTKHNAQERAKALRRKGWLARVTKVSGRAKHYPWVVWARKKGK